MWDGQTEKSRKLFGEHVSESILVKILSPYDKDLFRSVDFHGGDLGFAKAVFSADDMVVRVTSRSIAVGS